MARLGLHFRIIRENERLLRESRNTERRMARHTADALSLPDTEFVGNFRLSKDHFLHLHEEIRHLIPEGSRKSDIHSKFKLLVALSFFATGSYQKIVGNSGHNPMSQQSVSRAIRDVCTALNNPELQGKYIKFPRTRQERDSIKRRFYEKFGIPAVLGCIDGTHVAIIRPSENEERFFNRKHFHSRNVMIICDADMNILSVDASFGGYHDSIGSTGASHDSFIWNQHPVKEHLIDLNASGENVYLLGDSGYAQREIMMTPILDAQEGSPEEHYTQLVCSARNTVERTIGVLKMRWRCLLGHRVLHYHPNVAAKIINSCCLLHNICNRQQDAFEMVVTNEDSNGDIEPNPSGSTVESNTAELRRGIERRATLVQQLWAARF